MSQVINVTKTFLPPREEYDTYLDSIWNSGQLTNQGSLLSDFELECKKYLNVDNFNFVSNGTLALQLSIRALGLNGSDIITTPFSYVATTSSILWEQCNPIFVDIEPDTFCIDATKIEAAITKNTRAIMPVHVFGFPCDIEAIEDIAARYDLKVIYDAAHAFGVEYNGKSLLSYGDISTCSFHSTKPFHTIEGGCVITNDAKVSDIVGLIRRFGHDGDDHKMLGTNAKASEFQAAMGLANLPYFKEMTEKRGHIFDMYNELLGNHFKTPNVKSENGYKHNYSYYPILFKNEDHLKRCFEILAKHNIFPRRYFYPSLNNLPYLDAGQACPISEDVASRIACLPLFDSLSEDVVRKIGKILIEN